MDALQYKGYVGEFEYDPEDDVFYGEVRDINDTIVFQGRSLDELKQSLQNAVEHYLDFCARLGKEPDRALSGQFVLRVAPKEHLAFAKAARLAGKSLNNWAGDVLSQEAARTMSGKFTSKPRAGRGRMGKTAAGQGGPA